MFNLFFVKKKVIFFFWSADSWYLTSSKLERSYPGKVKVLKSKVKNLIQMTVLLEVDFKKMKLNDPGRQKQKTKTKKNKKKKEKKKG